MQKKHLALSIFASALFIAGAVSPALASRSIEELVEHKAAVVERMHAKATKALVDASQKDVFPEYFLSRSAAARRALRWRIDSLSLTVQSRFSVEEMCLINPEGAELSRIVGDEIAEDLALDEASAVFFAPGFAQPERKVHVAPLYMSADANKWVIAYVTPVFVGGEKKAILHYEHTLASYQRALNRAMSSNNQVLLAVDSDGFIVSDSRRDIGIDRNNDSEILQDYFERFDLSGMSVDQVLTVLGNDPDEGNGSVSADGKSYKVAYRKIQDWTIIGIEGL